MYTLKQSHEIRDDCSRVLSTRRLEHETSQNDGIYIQIRVPALNVKANAGGSRKYVSSYFFFFTREWIIGEKGARNNSARPINIAHHVKMQSHF